MPAKTSADFDELDQLRAEYFEAGRSSESKRIEKKKAANRQRELRLREQNAQAAQRSERARNRQTNRSLRLREKTAETTAARQQRQLELRAEQQQVARERIAQRDAERASREASARARPPTRRTGSAPLSSPNLAASSGGTSITGIGLTRQQTSKIILIITALGVIGAAVHNINGQSANVAIPVVDKSGKLQTVTVNNKLRSAAAVLIMGVVALIVNEIDPGIGLILGLGIAFDVVVTDYLGTNGVFTRLQNNLFNTSPTTADNPLSHYAGGKLPPGYTGPPIAYNPGVGGAVGVNPNPH